MNQSKNTIHNLLLEWGSKEKKLPVNNLGLKTKIITHLRSIPAKTSSVHQQIPWLSFTFAGLAVLMLLINPIQGPVQIKKFVGPTVPTTLPEIRETGITSSQDLKLHYSPYPIAVPMSDVPITDTREFMKTDYNARIFSRRIDSLVQTIQNTVRTFDGRIDRFNSSPRSGYVSFVIPANKLEIFRQTIKNLAGEKFLTENIYTENVLPQKQSIEQQEESIKKIIAQLGDEKNQLKANHKQILDSIQLKISQINNDLTAIKIKLDVTNDPAKRTELKAKESKLLSEKGGLETDIINENSTYANKFNILDIQIRNNETALDNVMKQDQELIDTVATVRGTISLDWISIWEIVRLYVPINVGFLIFGAGAIIAYLIHSRKRLYLP